MNLSFLNTGRELPYTHIIMHSHNRPYRTLMENLMKFSVLCLKPLSLSHSQREREGERHTHTHSHRHSITHTRSHTAHVTGLQWPWIFQTTRHSLPSIRNNAGLTHTGAHTQIHTHTQSSTHAAPPQQRQTHSHTSWPFNNEGEGDERWRGWRHRMRGGRNQLVQQCVIQLEPCLQLPSISL